MSDDSAASYGDAYTWVQINAGDDEGLALARMPTLCIITC